MARIELYGTSACPYTAELREHLRWRRVEFMEYDVESDPEARARLQALFAATPASPAPPTGTLSVPVLVEDGGIQEIGWRGRACMVTPS